MEDGKKQKTAAAMISSFPDDDTYYKPNPPILSPFYFLLPLPPPSFLFFFLFLFFRFCICLREQQLEKARKKQLSELGGFDIYMVR